LGELKGIGYPGVTDPSVTIRTRLRPTDGLDHDAAVQYEVAAMQGMAAALLPEDYNGLGYQNLISMVFKLMSFRDAWMRVAKASGNAERGSAPLLIAPLQLVILEEPEAHLHAQVQQVFIRKAYSVLRNHPDLRDQPHFTTQLIVSTHSSHLAHEVEFACLRYFKRLPAGYPDPANPVATVPVSTVINLTEAFGDDQETSRFAKRYLRATHCDLFFADAAILVEGAAERILLPHFVRREFQYLNHCYITWLEVGGSHAHRLKSLIDRLGLCALIVTDIDAGDPTQHRQSRRPEIGKGLVSNNATLKKWLPKEADIDKLLTGDAKSKIAEDGPLFAVRVAYQIPVKVEHNGARADITPSTFEDATVLENLSVVKNMTGGGLAKAFATVISTAKTPEDLARELYQAIGSGAKAEFALDLMELELGPEAMKCPAYVAEGLEWLQNKLKGNDTDILTPVARAADSINVAVNPAPISAEPLAAPGSTQIAAGGELG
jgi:predicted ATP-dependent endonuclease of OLD family